MIKEFADMWVLNWQRSRFLTMLEAYGVISGILACCIMAWVPGANMPMIFTTFLTSSVSLMITTWAARAAASFILFSIYTIINVVGTTNALL